MFADICQSHGVRRGGGEPVGGVAVLVDLDEEVVVDRWAGLTVQATLVEMHRPQPLGRAEPPDPVVADVVSGVAKASNGQSVAERGSPVSRTKTALMRSVSAKSRAHTGLARHL